MASAPLSVSGFKARSIMPSADVDALETQEPGFLDAQLSMVTDRINSQLRKRYAVPFESPVPEIFLGWLTAIVTPLAYRKRGWNPSDEQSQAIEQDRKDALAEVQLAADSEIGLFDLPLRETTGESGISRGGPLGYSEASPYDWTDVQAEAIRGR